MDGVVGTAAGTFIGRHRDKYAGEKHLQSDGNMPSLPEQETTRFRRGPMTRDLPQPVASRAAATEAVCQNGWGILAGSVRRMRPLPNAPTRNRRGQGAGRA
jgi:hypothetical protein